MGRARGDDRAQDSRAPYNVGRVYARLGEPDKAIDCLERSVTHGWAEKQWMANDPALLFFHNDPRLRAPIKRL
jgi:hypothetical protein